MNTPNKAGLTKPQFANVCNGSVLVNVESGFLYRIHERINRSLVLQRITPAASAPLIEIVKESQRKEWAL